MKAEHPDGMRVFISHGCILLEWGDAPTAASVQALRDAFEAYESEYGKPERTLSVAVIGPGSSLPDEGGREAMSALIQRFPADRASIVVTSTGFRGSITRSILAALALATGVRKTQRVFADVGPAIDWAVAEDPEARQHFEYLLGALRDLCPDGAPLWTGTQSG